MDVAALSRALAATAPGHSPGAGQRHRQDHRAPRLRPDPGDRQRGARTRRLAARGRRAGRQPRALSARPDLVDGMSSPTRSPGIRQDDGGTAPVLGAPRRPLRRAGPEPRQTADYLFQAHADKPDPGHRWIPVGPPQRRAEAIGRLALLGDRGWDGRVRRQLDLAGLAAAKITADPAFQLLEQPPSIDVCFECGPRQRGERTGSTAKDDSRSATAPSAEARAAPGVRQPRPRRGRPRRHPRRDPDRGEPLAPRR